MSARSELARVREHRASAEAYIQGEVNAAIGRLNRAGIWSLSRPPHDLRDAGEWDWYRALDGYERSYIARWWMSDTGSGPDAIAHALDAASTDEGMATWLGCRRQIDAATSMKIRNSRLGYVPGTAMTGGLSIDDLFGCSGYQLTRLFLPVPQCCEYLAELEHNEEVDDRWSDSSSTPTATSALEAAF